MSVVAPSVPSRQHATLAVLTSAALFGTTGTVLVNAPTAADPYSVGALRLLVGSLALIVISTRSRSRMPPASRHLWIGSTTVGAVGVAVFQLCYFLSVDRTGVAVGTIVTIGSGPMFSGVLTIVLDRRLPKPTWAIGTAIGVAGVALIGLVGKSTAIAGDGIALAFCAGCGWAVFAAVGKYQITNGRFSTASMAAMFTGGAALLLPLLITHDVSWAASSDGAATVLYLGVATVGIAYTLYGFALRHLPTPTVITLTLLEPITAALLAAVVVHERLQLSGWVGVALALVGLATVARAEGPGT